jgi:hypothetical protein
LPVFLTTVPAHEFHFRGVRDIIESRGVRIYKYGQLSKEGMNAYS